MVFEFINSRFTFSLYPNLITVDKPSANIYINQLIEIIKYGYIKDVITILIGQYQRRNITKTAYQIVLIPSDSISKSWP